MIKKNSLLDMYFTFFKIGSVTFGGGYAMLPILEREVVEKREWCTKEEVMDYYAVSQGLPGIIAVNISVFIGYHQQRLAGSIAAALGVVSPCIFIITFLAACMQSFQNNTYVRHALAGISVCVSALIANSVFGLWKKGIVDTGSFVVFSIAFFCALFTSISPILCVIGAAVAGILIQSIRRNKQ